MENNSAPLLSVIIPTYNRCSILPRAIESVLNQTYEDFELIVIDDCSSDNTAKVVKEYMERDSRIRYIKNEVNLHAQKTRNKAINKAKGKYIASLDDDDYWLPQKLELQMHLMLTGDFAIVGCDHSYDVIPKNPPFIDVKNLAYKEKSIEQFSFSNRGFSPSKSINKKEHIIAVGGYDSDIPGPEGLDLFYRIVSRFGKAVWVDEVLCVHFTNHGFERITDKMIETCEKEFIKNLKYRSKSAQRFRKAEIELMKFNSENSFGKKIKHLKSFFENFESKFWRNYLKLFIAKVLTHYPPFNWLLVLYRKYKYS